MTGACSEYNPPTPPDDIRLGLGDWLRAFTLPIELLKLPLSNRDVRLEAQARQDFADDARREHVIRARFTTMIAALPALLIVVSGVSLTAQLEFVQRLALVLMPGTFGSPQVAPYRALGDSAGDYVHVLSTGGGSEPSLSSSAPSRRPQAESSALCSLRTSTLTTLLSSSPALNAQFATSAPPRDYRMPSRRLKGPLAC